MFDIPSLLSTVAEKTDLADRPSVLPLYALQNKSHYFNSRISCKANFFQKFV